MVNIVCSIENSWVAHRLNLPFDETCTRSKREFFIANLLVRTHFIIVMIRRTGLAPWDFEFPFPGSLTSTFLARRLKLMLDQTCTRSTI